MSTYKQDRPPLISAYGLYKNRKNRSSLPGDSVYIFWMKNSGLGNRGSQMCLMFGQEYQMFFSRSTERAWGKRLLFFWRYTAKLRWSLVWNLVYRSGLFVTIGSVCFLARGPRLNWRIRLEESFGNIYILGLQCVPWLGRGQRCERLGVYQV